MLLSRWVKRKLFQFWVIDPECQGELVHLSTMCVSRGKVPLKYVQVNMVSFPGIYLDIKRNDTIHSLMYVNEIYSVLTILTRNWRILGGEELWRDQTKKDKGNLA